MTACITRAEQLGYCEGYSSSAGPEANPFAGPHGIPDANNARDWARGFRLGRMDQQSRQPVRPDYWPQR